MGREADIGPLASIELSPDAKTSVDRNNSVFGTSLSNKLIPIRNRSHHCLDPNANHIRVDLCG